MRTFPERPCGPPYAPSPAPPCHTSSGTAAGRQRQSFTDAAARGVLSGKRREDPSRLCALVLPSAKEKTGITGVVLSCSAGASPPLRRARMIYACASVAVVEQDIKMVRDVLI